MNSAKESYGETEQKWNVKMKNEKNPQDKVMNFKGRHTLSFLNTGKQTTYRY